MEAKIYTRTKTQITNSIAQSFPSGRLFEAKDIEGSNLRKLLEGLGIEIGRIEKTISQDVYENYFINEGFDGLLEEWEGELGIPDTCFTINNKTRVERIINVIAKLQMSSVITAQDYIDFASIFGIDITIENTSKFVMTIRGDNIAGGFPPYDVPFTPTSGSSFVQCIFNKIKPANVEIIYLNN